MNNSAFLSDSLENNTGYNVQIKQSFIATNNSSNSNTKSYEVSKYDKQKSNNFIVKSATSRKWSIKFKK